MLYKYKALIRVAGELSLVVYHVPDRRVTLPCHRDHLKGVLAADLSGLAPTVQSLRTEKKTAWTNLQQRRTSRGRLLLAAQANRLSTD